MDLHTSFITDVILERILIEILEIMPLLCVPIRSLSLLLKGLSYLPKGTGLRKPPSRTAGVDSHPGLEPLSSREFTRQTRHSSSSGMECKHCSASAKRTDSPPARAPAAKETPQEASGSRLPARRWPWLPGDNQHGLDRQA